MDNEESELWRKVREAQKERRSKRLPMRSAEIMGLVEQGFKVEKKSDYHFRINDLLDLHPIHNRWHDLRKNRWGGAKNLADFAIHFFK
jgi:hypothetical protein